MITLIRALHPVFIAMWVYGGIEMANTYGVHNSDIDFGLVALMYAGGILSTFTMYLHSEYGDFGGFDFYLTRIFGVIPAAFIGLCSIFPIFMSLFIMPFDFTDGLLFMGMGLIVLPPLTMPDQFG